MGHGFSHWLDNLEGSKYEYLSFGNVHYEFLESGKKKAYTLILTKNRKNE